MKIILFANGLDHPAAIEMANALIDADISFTETTQRPVGSISAQPCVCALYDNDFIFKSWSVVPLNIQDIETVAAQGGTPPEQPAQKMPTISRIRFDAVFASAIGDLVYETVLDAVASIAATSPMTEDSAKVRRAWRALNSVATVDYPLGPWREADLDDANGDLTGQFLKVVASLLTQSIPDIADKIDAGLAAWPEI